MSMNQDDELVEVKLPRSEYVILRKVLEREQAYGYFKKMISNSWIWIVAGGLLSVFALWDYVKLLFVKV